VAPSTGRPWSSSRRPSAYSRLDAKRRRVFIWTHATGPAARFRNTVIGTLVQDISDGVDIERAVAGFEQKVAPTNYKRTTAVITPVMVKKAMETIEALGLEPALERRFARLADISVKDVLWVDGGVRPLMKGALETALLKEAQAPRAAKKDEDRAEDITLDAFMKDVLPTATGMELFFKGEHLGNLVSLTAPVHPEPRSCSAGPTTSPGATAATSPTPSRSGSRRLAARSRTTSSGSRCPGSTMTTSTSTLRSPGKGVRAPTG
jgi:hypothetical protein